MKELGQSLVKRRRWVTYVDKKENKSRNRKDVGFENRVSQILQS